MTTQFEGYIVTDTPRAILFHCHYWDDPEFLPKSQLEIRRDMDTEEVVVIASTWISKQKGLQEVDFDTI